MVLSSEVNFSMMHNPSIGSRLRDQFVFFHKISTFVESFMEKANCRWHRFRLFIVGLLIVSLLGPFNYRGFFPSLQGYSFVDVSGSFSKSNLQLFDEEKAGEERFEKDVDDDFDEKNQHSREVISCFAYAPLSSLRDSSRKTYSNVDGQSLTDLPIYLAHHSLLI